ncbi:MAG: hypothetical protein KDA42_09590, partial [Planctomycetales bacterium]|nr:hypothetical protein [Planctomycetales bacterium]
MSMEDDPVAQTASSLRLSDCVIRGEASLYEAASQLAGAFQWENGLLAISGRAFELAASEPGNKQRGSLRADLNHVTMLSQ